MEEIRYASNNCESLFQPIVPVREHRNGHGNINPAFHNSRDEERMSEEGGTNDPYSIEVARV